MKRVLIANRGEIACRIIKTLKKMGITSISIYSEADNNSLHKHMADESFCIGPSPSTQSYLNIDKICEVIKNSNADAVHPGFGFLSENYKFAKRLEEMGINFIAPNPLVIKKMGDKVEAKKIASAAGVNIVNGYMGDMNNIEHLIEVSGNIGFPVIIKAAAGGGGRGMRVVHSPDKMAEALSLASNEAQKSFGDSKVFIEKYIEMPRHIEIQILADKSGNVLCLGERECSIQRRYQKVIEEAPSCFINNSIRQKMYSQSIMLAKEVGYYSAGTVEFIVDHNKNFYFLEMNTRIQVEHPVTELVTGLDIVEEMINIAQDKPLSIRQDNIKMNGHAIEARIYAEDPSGNFLPATGVITQYIEPEHEGIRVDTGVTSGAAVTMFYDPMLAKVCVHGKDRKDAILKIQKALREFHILGVTNNISFLQSIMSHPHFIAGDIYTGFIDEFYPQGFVSNKLTENIEKIFIAIILYIFLYREHRYNNLFGKTNLEKKWVVKVADTFTNVTVEYIESNLKVHTESNDLIMLHTSWVPGDALFIANINDDEVIVKLEKKDINYILQYDGCVALCGVYSPATFDLFKFMQSVENDENTYIVLSPITGMLTKTYVVEGEEVKTGQPLFIIEAMKMENTFYAQKNAKISKIEFVEGENVNTNDIIIRYAN